MLKDISHKYRNFIPLHLEIEDIKILEEFAKIQRGNILKMTTNASSGHPGGSMSSVDIYTILFAFSDFTPENFNSLNRDRIVISHGHTSPGVYSVLGSLGFFDLHEAIAHFRQVGSPFEGHIENHIPGIDWSTGNLGQGLSAACGFALSQRMKGINKDVFVVMGDGEQQKGQISEARRFAKKFGLNNITCIVDYNNLQISGATQRVMYQDIKANFESDGWFVIEIDGHNFSQIYEAIRFAKNYSVSPVMILARTTMGKGVSFMENRHEYHGKPLTEEELDRALKELGIENDLKKYRKMRDKKIKKIKEVKSLLPPIFEIGSPILYSPETKTDNRSASGKALFDIASKNMDKLDSFAVFDCDLAGSVKTSSIEKNMKNSFFESGIMEHHTAVCSGALSRCGVITFWADFGVFGVDETYNQQRLNDINNTNLKVIVTHTGSDVGEDGKTHQCIDYLGLLRNLYGFKVIVPADPNQTDRVIRYVVNEWGNFCVAMGRSKCSVITNENGSPFFDEKYEFNYGKFDILREGKEVLILTYGPMVEKAIKIYEILKERGIDVGVVNVSCPLKIEDELMEKIKKAKLIITYEDHNPHSGLYASICDKIVEKGISKKVIPFGITNYPPSGKSSDILKYLKIDPESIAEKILKELNG